MSMFSKANSKLQKLASNPAMAEWLTDNRKVYSFPLLSGWSCPFAKDCLSKVHSTSNGLRIVDGKDTQFRCYSASQEAVYPAVYAKRKRNFDKMRSFKDVTSMADHICSELPKNAGIIRIHDAGEFFNQNYMMAWARVAFRNPNLLFYAYTKALNWFVDLQLNGLIPSNLLITASRGGRLDHLIDQHKLKEARVVYSVDQASKMSLDIDNDDSHAAHPAFRYQSFALLIHGVQPKGSDAAAALRKLNRKRNDAA
jgi:hypothetical protein